MAKKDIFSELIKGEAKKIPINPLSSFDKNLIIILPELKSYIPPLTIEEFAQLEQNILTEGCREALIVWKQGERYVLVDGHNRYTICQKHRLDFKVEIKDFAEIEQVKNWMINNQLGKRNVTEEVKSYLRGLQYKLEKASHGTNQHTKTGVDIMSTPQKTLDKVAGQHKVSGKTIQRDEKFYEGLELLAQNDKDLKWKILNREINIPKNIISELPKKDNKFIEEIIEKATQGEGFSSNRIKETKTKKEDLDLLLEAMETANDKVIIEIKGSFLIENNLADYWQKLRKLKTPITADFTDYLTWGQAKAIGLVK
jgi:hypothetical protein